MTTPTPLPPLEDLQALKELDAWVLRLEDWHISKLVSGEKMKADDQLADKSALYRDLIRLKFDMMSWRPLLTHLTTLTARAQAAEGAYAKLREENAALQIRDAGWVLQSGEQEAEIKTLEADLYAARDENHRLSAQIATLARPASGPGEAVAHSDNRK